MFTDVCSDLHSIGRPVTLEDGEDVKLVTIRIARVSVFWFESNNMTNEPISARSKTFGGELRCLQTFAVISTA